MNVDERQSLDLGVGATEGVTPGVPLEPGIVTRGYGRSKTRIDRRLGARLRLSYRIRLAF